MKYLFTICIALTVNLIVAQVLKSTTPSWVISLDYEENPDFNSENVFNGSIELLRDTQINVPKQQRFVRSSVKILDNIGVQNSSSISVNYDPSYEALKFHFITIKRSGEYIDKFKAGDFQLIRKESNSENFIYDGTMTAQLNLSDVRKGDIIEYSYTLTGFNPIHNGMFSGSFQLDGYGPVGLASVIINTEKNLTSTLYNLELEAKISDYNGLKQYNWEHKSLDQNLEFDVNQPLWKFTTATLIVSEYKSWQEVVDWGVRTYEYESRINKDLSKKIDHIISNNPTESKRIDAVLNFVQDEIRYLGLEDGIGSYKPFSPDKVFGQRFGDCKDKSQLMVAMLTKMGIEAYPMLVNTSLGNKVSDLPPTPIIFDHCVVKVIDGKNNTAWFDPTISNQGGLFGNSHFPNYGKGLVLKNGNTEFDEYFPISDNLIETLDVYELESVGKGALLKVKTKYHQGEADRMRTYFKSNSLSSISKEFHNYYSNLFKANEVEQMPTFEDDSIKNIFTVYESYKLDSIWEPYPNIKNNVATSFVAYNLFDVISMPEERNRNSPFALYYPATRRHKIKIKLPTSWYIKDEDDFVADKHFYFSYDINYKSRKNELDLEYYFKVQEPYVESADIASYYDEVSKVANSNSFHIYIDKSDVTNFQSSIFSEKSNTDQNSPATISKILLKSFWVIAIVLVIAVLIGIVFIIIQNRKS